MENETAKIRRNIGMTLQQVAERLGVHYMTVWRWENGTRPPQAALMVLRSLKVKPADEVQP